MAGIGTAARNWEDELEKQKQQATAQQKQYNNAMNQGIGTPAYHEPAGSIGTPAANRGIGTAATNTQQPIQVMQGVTEGTRQKLNQAQEQGYQPSDAAQHAQAALQQLQAQKPQGYTSKYSADLENILNELKGQKFNYSLNGDAFFNAMKDARTQAAKQASMNAMGQAAGLTGGYGNSYAQAAANQAAQQELLHLNDDAMNAYNLALQRFQIEQQGLGDQFGRLLQMEQSDYGKYRDTVSDFNTERGYLTDQYNTEEDRAYDRYKNNLDYLTKLAEIENADYRSEQERQEAIRQFNEQYALDQQKFQWQQDVDERDYGLNREKFEYDKEQDEIANALNREQFEYGKEQDAIANALRQEQFDYGKEQDAQAQANWQAQFDYGKEQDEQAQKNWQAQMDYQAMMDMLSQQNWQEQMDENIRQFNESMNWDKMSAQQKYAADYAMAILQMGQMPSKKTLEAAGLSEEDAQKMMTKLTSGGGPSKGTGTYYVDNSGNYYENKNGVFVKVDKNNLNQNYRVDESKKNQLYDMSQVKTGKADDELLRRMGLI